MLFAPVGVVARSTTWGLQGHANHPNLDLTGLSILTPIRLTIIFSIFLLMILDYNKATLESSLIDACAAAVWCDACSVAWVCGCWREIHEGAAVSERTLKDVAVVQA